MKKQWIINSDLSILSVYGFSIIIFFQSNFSKITFHSVGSYFWAQSFIPSFLNSCGTSMTVLDRTKVVPARWTYTIIKKHFFGVEYACIYISFGFQKTFFLFSDATSHARLDARGEGFIGV